MKPVGRNKYQSIKKSLNLESNRELENLIRSITLENLIALKLEIAAEDVGGKLYGFPIWNSTKFIIKDSLIKFALSSTNTHREAANLLGITVAEMRNFIKSSNLNDFLDKK